MFFAHKTQRAILLSLLLLAILLIIGYTYVKDSAAWPINSVQITTQLHYITPASVQEVVLPEAQKSFFTVNVSQLRRDLETMPWVEKASIARVWPDTLQISIAEQQPVVRWGRTGFIGRGGDLFDPKQNYALSLPQLSGPDSRYKEVFVMFWRLNTQLETVGLSIVELQLSLRGAWVASLSNGLALYLGQDDIVARVDRFIKVMNQLNIEAAQNTYIDLRYTNGFVVGRTEVT